MNIVGIDPGMSGAIAYIPQDDLPLVWDVPTFHINGKNRLDFNALAMIFEHIDLLGGADKVVIEAVSAMPGQGVTSMFTFGSVFGALQACVAVYGIAITHVAPAKWKRDMRLSNDKDASRRLAIQTWPAASEKFKLKKHSDRAEAALLALWGLKHA
jgi:crossover junction endodeoxyribonuclease RuvC